jgi:hypothetical protein
MARLAEPTIYCCILITVFGALLDRFGRPRVEQDLEGQEDLGEGIDRPADRRPDARRAT